MIEVRGLTHRYGPLTAIEELSFSVRRGEVMGLLGPNGAGKTTTLRAVVGLLSPSSGSVRIGGHDMARDPLRARRLLGFLPENVPLYRELRVREFLRYVACAKGVPNARVSDEIDRAVSACGLAPVLTRMIGFCSRGFRQRIGLAQALVGDPPVLVLDEPTVGLDPAQVVEIREAVAKLAREKAVILSTHVLPEASLLCSRVLIVNRGRLVADGAPDELERMLAGGIRVKVVCAAADPTLGWAVEGVFHRQSMLSGFARVVAEPERMAWVVDLQHADGVPEMVSALVAAGCAVHEVAPQRQGLEGVFLALVRHDPASASPPAAVVAPEAS